MGEGKMTPTTKQKGNEMSMLFPREQMPRRKPRKLMHVIDAGGCGEGHHVQFKCKHCGHDDGWGIYDNTITELKRGMPCPKCN